MATKSKSLEYFEAVGRRKTSVARVRLWPNKGGGITVNEKSAEDYFQKGESQIIVQEALTLVGIAPCKISAHISGGGAHSQAEALRHGISRALLLVDANLRKILKHNGFLKRDPRMKERRKFGLKKARKAPQWAKR